MIAAFFDLDGTLATVHVWQALARHNWQQRVNRLALAGYMGTHYPQYLLYKLHLVSRDAAYTSWARDMPWLIGGLTLERAQTVFDWVADRQVIPSIRPDALTLLRQQQAQGHRVVLVSGTFQPLLETIGARLGVTDCVGTRLKVSDDRYTGAPRRPCAWAPARRLACGSSWPSRAPTSTLPPVSPMAMASGTCRSWRW
jgi:HAD superfamily phosphoserine phosphatase-like hydrolase